MKNILHVVNVYFVIPYFLGDQLTYFKSKGYTEHIACSCSNELEDYSKIKGFEYYETRIARSISPISDIKSIYNIYKYINRNNINIVVGHTPKGGMIAMISGFLARVPNRIYFRHGLVYETSRGLKRFVLKFVDKLTSRLATKIVVVSPSVGEKSIEDNLNKTNKQVVLGAGTCNGINTDKFYSLSISEVSKQNLKTKLCIEKEFVIGYVGRLVNDKGIKDLIEGFLFFSSKYPYSKLLLVGMLDERDSLSDEIMNKIKFNNNIIITGYIRNQDIEKYYALMDVFVLPSYREGFPTSVLEASSMSLPVLTTKATGCIDSILEDITGIYIDHSGKSICDALETLFINPDLRRQLGGNGRKFVCDNFSQNIIWNEIEKLY